jgi:hypothetical protein
LVVDRRKVHEEVPGTASFVIHNTIYL